MQKANNCLLLWDEVFPHMFHQFNAQHAFSLQFLPVLSECFLLTFQWCYSDHHLANVNQPLSIQHHQSVQFWSTTEVKHHVAVMEVVDHCPEVILFFDVTNLLCFSSSNIKLCVACTICQ